VATATVTCSGGCLCQPSTGTSSGTISDGTSDYFNNANCIWLIASSGLISLSFSSFNTESGRDFVTINRCTSSSSCVEQVARLSGSSVSLSTIYTSSTGYMQMVLTSDGSVLGSGFVASWSVPSTSTCTECPTNSNSPAGSSALTNCTCNAGYTKIPARGSYPTLTADATNLVAWYKLDGDLTDSSGITGSLTNQGGTLAYARDTTLDSNLPYAWYAVGSGTSNVNYALTPALNRNVPLSFVFWFKTIGTGGYTIMGYGDKSVENPTIQFDFYQGELQVSTALSGQWITQPLATGLALNTWHFVVYTLSNTSPVSTILYVNGTQRATGTGTTGQTLPRFKDLTIANSGDTWRGFVGQIGDIRIYSKVLTQAEITTLYNINIINTPASCLACPANSNSASSSSAITACTCNAGSTGPNGGPCAACVAGKFKTLTGIATCTDCGAGTYSTAVGASGSSTCIACPSNSTSPAGSAALTNCTCNIGSTGPNGGGPCAACMAGKYKTSKGSVACTDCGAGTYSTAVGASGSSTCIACPSNSTSSAGSASLTNCSSLQVVFACLYGVL
jgi:hypothetical protein